MSPKYNHFWRHHNTYTVYDYQVTSVCGKYSFLLFFARTVKTHFTDTPTDTTKNNTLLRCWG